MAEKQYKEGDVDETIIGKAMMWEDAANTLRAVSASKPLPTDLSDDVSRLLGKVTNYDVLQDGTLGALDETVEIAAAGLSTIGLGISGTWVGTIVAELEVGDGVWDVIPLIEQTLAGAALSTTANGTFLLGVAGALTVRIRMSLYTSGTATVYMEGSSAPAGVFLSRSIPTGLNSIGTVGLDAGTALVGKVGIDQTTPGTTNRVDGGDEIIISQTPTVTAGAYTAGDAVGGLLTFANAARAAGMGGVAKNLLVIDDAGQDVEMELWLFKQTFTAMADNAPWAPSEADLRNLVGIISTADGAWFAAGTPSVARVEPSQGYTCVGTSLFGQLVTRGTPTFAATDDVSAILGLLRH